MNNFGTSNLEMEQELIVQGMALKFIAGALSFIFVGALFTGLVGAVIWLTSGGHEGRNDMSVGMIKSSLVGMIASFIGYVVMKLVANFMGVEF